MTRIITQKKHRIIQHNRKLHRYSVIKNIASNQIKNFDAKEHFNLSEEDIMEVYRHENFTECEEEEFEKVMYNFHGFKDSSIMLASKSKKNKKCDIVSIKDSTIQLKEEGLKRGAVSLEESLF